jgi:hypothetical protein
LSDRAQRAVKFVGRLTLKPQQGQELHSPAYRRGKKRPVRLMYAR